MFAQKRKKKEQIAQCTGFIIENRMKQIVYKLFRIIAMTPMSLETAW